MRKGRRKKLGGTRGLINRERVYRIDDGLEIDDVESYSVTRRRVYFNDVLMITKSVKRGWGHPVFTLTFAIVFLLIAVAVGRSEAVIGFVIFAIAVVPFVTAFFLWLVVGNHVVSVWGRRSRAVMHFWFRTRKAERVFRDLTGLTSSYQRRLGRQFEAPEDSK
jgi:hypothetical protein